MLVLSLPGIIAGVGLLKFRPWARIVTIVLSALNLMNIPFGTILGVYGLWVMLSDDGSRSVRQRLGAAGGLSEFATRSTEATHGVDEFLCGLRQWALCGSTSTSRCADGAKSSILQPSALVVG